jgi:uncharacterized protein YhbP (UPF0306 family)
MTIATAGPSARSDGGPDTGGSGNIPHAANVFYAVDSSLRLIFLSKPSSLHGRHIGERAAVAVTVTEPYDDWTAIQGVQLWGEARRVKGAARVAALAVYLARFPFVDDIVKRPGMTSVMKGIGVYRVQPQRVAFTDNTTGVFGRESLQLVE